MSFFSKLLERDSIGVKELALQDKRAGDSTLLTQISIIKKDTGRSKDLTLKSLKGLFKRLGSRQQMEFLRELKDYFLD